MELISKNDDGEEVPRMDVKRIDDDLEFADRLGGTNPKNYQLWYHRRALLEFRFKGDEDETTKVSVARKELEYVDRILDDDSKNYHAWSHRQWIVRTLDNPELWSSEIEYSHSKILSDPRNNSAWSERWYALHRGGIVVSSAKTTTTFETNANASEKASSIPSLETAEEESYYALKGAEVDPFNESPWRYLIGILMEQWRWAHGSDDEGMERRKELVRRCIGKIREMKLSLEERQKQKQQLQQQGQHLSLEEEEEVEVPMGVCMSLQSALVDLLVLFVEENDSLNEAVMLVGELMEEDYVRRKYWRKRQREISALVVG